MPPRLPVRPGNILLLIATLASLTVASPAAQTPTNAPTKAVPAPAAETKAAPAQLKIPESTFVIPTRPQQGRDPFFPQSTRLFEAALIVAPTNQPNVPSTELQLKGLSGLRGHRLAMINNHTFEVGEEGDVVTSSGRVRVRCLAIRDDSVLIQVNGEPRILRFRSGL